MKRLYHGIGLALVAGGLSAVPALQAQASGHQAAGGSSLVSRMAHTADGKVAITHARATGKIAMIRTAPHGDLLPDVAGGTRHQAAAKASTYLSRYAAAFGTTRGQLVRSEVRSDRYGETLVYGQRYHGVPVFGARLMVQVNRSGALTSVNGYAAPRLHLSTSPRLSARQAAHRALGTVRQQPPSTTDGREASVKGLRATPHLVIYRMGQVRQQRGAAVLTYQVEVTNHRTVRDMVFIDAQTGKLVNRYHMIDDALDRHLYEANGSSDPNTFVQVWKEGDPFPGSLTDDQRHEVDFTGDAYWFFRDTFGRDSYDGKGHSMTTVNNDGRINCPNANWNGLTTNYCNGVSGDDVVAHEWGHAYTEYTSGLIYQWQAGALNESYSDVWGETVDLINNKLDEGETVPVRPSGVCSSHTAPRPLLTVNSPSSIAKNCVTGGYLGPDPLVPVTADVVAPTDAAEPGGTTTDGCSTYNQVVTGKIVLVDRGLCTFVAKAQVAQAAGAAGVIIGNRDNAPISFTSADHTLPPTVSVGLTDRDQLRATLASGQTVNASIKDQGGNRFDSYRWLIGEKATAFGSALRDMWQPTCTGDPGKVSDAEYKCATDDSGGVHSNSGVTNHAYALLVDGATYNGVTISGIGLDKAANLWWYNQTHFLTPTSGFPEMADGLQASCTALVGQPINHVNTTPNAAPTAATPITAADCQQVANVITATQLRAEPTQCNFQPLFGKNAPSPCGAGTKNSVVWKDDFSDGLGNWTPSSQVVFAGGVHYPWQTKASTDTDHPGQVAFVPDLANGGVCSNGAGDASSRDSITSTAIHIPNAATKSPRLTFDHSIASEAGVDGGNIQISVNGSSFTLMPKSAYLYNGPNMTLIAPPTNTNPMAGQQAWSGADGGKLTTKWGTTVVDLSAAGVSHGDTVQLRFDFGRDGCGGVSGWSIDNVTVSTCKASTKVTAVHAPDPSTFGSPSSLRVTVANQDATGETPTGDVRLSDAAGNTVASGTLAAGFASLDLPAFLPEGGNRMTVTYVGNDGFEASSTPVTANVSGAGHQQSATRTHVKKHGPVKFRKNFRVSVRVAATDGSAVTGTVTITQKGKVIGRGTVSDGHVRVLIKKNLKVGKRALVAHYQGSTSAMPSSARFKVKIVKR